LLPADSHCAYFLFLLVESVFVLRPPREHQAIPPREAASTPSAPESAGSRGVGGGHSKKFVFSHIFELFDPKKAWLEAKKQDFIDKE
jgi:hypothetical protein